MNYGGVMSSIDTLFLDVGGVILTNGWDHVSRKAASEQFGFDHQDFEAKHQLVYAPHELGHMSLKEYLDYTLFYKERPFSQEQFLEFMYEQSKPLPHMLDFLRSIKEQYGIHLVALSNEGKELMHHRIHHCGLKDVLDFFIVSAFVGHRKPDPLIYRLALDLVQSVPKKIVYMDDRLPLVQVAKQFGLQGIHHRSFESTKKQLDVILTQ